MGITSLLPKRLLISNKAEHFALSLYVATTIAHHYRNMGNNFSIDVFVLDFGLRSPSVHPCEVTNHQMGLKLLRTFLPLFPFSPHPAPLGRSSYSLLPNKTTSAKIIFNYLRKTSLLVVVTKQITYGGQNRIDRSSQFLSWHGIIRYESVFLSVIITTLKSNELSIDVLIRHVFRVW